MYSKDKQNSSKVQSDAYRRFQNRSDEVDQVYFAQDDDQVKIEYESNEDQAAQGEYENQP